MNIRMRLSAAALVTCLLVTGCAGRAGESGEQDLHRLQAVGDAANGQKPVIYLLLDSLMYQSIDRGVKEGKLPAFQYLIEHGQYYRNLVSSFPTMSVSIDSTLLTGSYPDKHHVPGLIWYSSDDNRLINYGTGPLEVVKTGLTRSAIDALTELNRSHLNPDATTIFEELERKGLTTASINGLVYRGTHTHRLSAPAWLRGMIGLPSAMEVKGPSFFSFGAFSNPLDNVLEVPDGPASRFGFNNEYALRLMTYLVKADKLPHFMYAYWPDLDKNLHKHGPDELSGVIAADKQLQKLLDAFGSKEKALERAVFVISGDSGMTQVLPTDEDPTVDLPALLLPYQTMLPSRAADPEAELALAVNETMAYVYKLHAPLSLGEIAAMLCKDERIDFAAWKSGGYIEVMQGGTGRKLRYRPGGGSADPYGQAWTIEQDAAVLDLQAEAEHAALSYGRYPDVLQRLYSSLHSHPGEFLVVSAKEGYELAGSGSPVHGGGGGHGGMTAQESLVPLIIAGTDEKPERLRIVDMKPYLLKLILKKP